MSLDAARLPGRLNVSGNLQNLLEQDRTQWDQELVAEGMRFLDLSATGMELTEYHIEAAIASVHARTPRAEETDWKSIVSLYDKLLALRPSPIVALNRAIAIAQLDGPERGLEELGKIVDRDRLVAYPFYFAALGEFELLLGRTAVARERFRAATALSRSPMERSFFEQRLNMCGPKTIDSDHSHQKRSPPCPIDIESDKRALKMIDGQMDFLNNTPEKKEKKR